MSSEQIETLETDQGEIESTKAEAGSPWLIASPWGDQLFHGSTAQVRVRMQQIKHIMQKEDGQ